tara:strand:+ start:144 stop:344 length:201 start_codon:yes stop_codon:yes gene_type:complete
MGDQKRPWEDVPVEVLIEEERKKREEWDRNRPRIELPIGPPGRHKPPQKDSDSEEEEEHKIVIKLF